MKKAIIGFGGYAREVAEYLNEDVNFFVEDQYVTKGCLPISEFDPEKHSAIVAIGDPKIRQKVVESMPEETVYFTFIHPTATVGKKVILGEGTIIGPYSIVTTDVVMGKHCILNLHNSVGHDCVLGDYFSAMPGAIVSGNVSAKNRIYMGSNSTIREGIFLNNDVVIGMNACVASNCQVEGIYVGIPAKLK